MDFERVVKRIGHVLVFPFVHAAKIIKLIDTSITDEPKAKAAIVGLIEQISTITADGALVIEGKGIDVTADLAELAAMKALWTYVTGTFIPAVDAIYADVEADLKDDTSTTSTATASVAVVTGPGLHTVTAA